MMIGKGFTMDDKAGSTATGEPVFSQDPHRVRELSECNLEVAIGREVRSFRRHDGPVDRDAVEN